MRVMFMLSWYSTKVTNLAKIRGLGIPTCARPKSDAERYSVNSDWRKAKSEDESSASSSRYQGESEPAYAEIAIMSASLNLETASFIGAALAPARAPIWNS